MGYEILSELYVHLAEGMMQFLKMIQLEQFHHGIRGKKLLFYTQVLPIPPWPYKKNIFPSPFRTTWTTQSNTYFYRMFNFVYDEAYSAANASLS